MPPLSPRPLARDASPSAERVSRPESSFSFRGTFVSAPCSRRVSVFRVALAISSRFCVTDRIKRLTFNLALSLSDLCCGSCSRSHEQRKSSRLCRVPRIKPVRVCVSNTSASISCARFPDRGCCVLGEDEQQRQRERARGGRGGERSERARGGNAAGRRRERIGNNPHPTQDIQGTSAGSGVRHPPARTPQGAHTRRQQNTTNKTIGQQKPMQHNTTRRNKRANAQTRKQQNNI